MNHDPNFSIVDRANELRGTGADVISLAAGEPGGPVAHRRHRRARTSGHR